MKKILLFSLCLLLTNFIGQNLFAGKHRVNNNPEFNAEFTDIQTAIDAASAGDTLYIEGSLTIYESDSIFINTPLMLFGPGYFLEENDSTYANKLSAQIQAKFVFKPGSSGSQLSGFYFYYGEIIVQSNDLTISRNYLDANIILYSQASQIYISQNIWTWGGLSFDYSNVVSANIFFLNNIFYENVGSILISDNSIGFIENNVYLGVSGIGVSNSTIRNNIIVGGIYVGNNTVSNNFEYITLEDFFLMTGSTDGQYRLKPGSPAIGAGYDGTDCGAYGGAQPYVLSGLPPIPHIYEAYIDVIGTNEDGLQVQIKAKTQN
ncbi:MAG: hypothetical protein WC341_07415 [Bacteroidales bacterium]